MLTSEVGLSATQRERARGERRARGILTTIEAAEYLGTTQRTLDWQRCKGKGPPCHKDGGRYYYRRDELDAYHASCGPSRRRSRVNAALVGKERDPAGHDSGEVPGCSEWE